jgi:hypothetical protein
VQGPQKQAQYRIIGFGTVVTVVTPAFVHLVKNNMKTA